jgi:hypothetical protein
MAPPPFFNPAELIIELVFTLIAVFFCFVIYFKTAESYRLTKHKGIQYFRDAFLFFGLSYIIRFLFSPVILSRPALDYILPRGMSIILFILPLGYFSTIAIFYLLYSTIWKRFDNFWMVYTGHAVAILLPLAAFIMRSQKMLLYLQTALLVIVAIISIVPKKDEKRISQTKMLYLFICLLWLINLWVIDSVRHIPHEAKIVFQVISLAVFISIYYRVYKWIK